MQSHRLSQLMNSLVILLTGSPPFLLSKNFATIFPVAGRGAGVSRLSRLLPRQSPLATRAKRRRAAKLIRKSVSCFDLGSLWRGGVHFSEMYHPCASTRKEVLQPFVAIEHRHPF